MMEKCHFSLGLSSINYHVGWLVAASAAVQWLSLRVPHNLAHKPETWKVSGISRSHPTLVYIFFETTMTFLKKQA